ncbi:unnamed protein product [Pylaiella littoralis]
MATPAPAKGGEVASKARRPLPITAGEKIVEGERLRDEAHSLIEDRPKKAAVKFRTVFAFTKGLIPHTSELAVYAAATGQQTVIDQQQQGFAGGARVSEGTLPSRSAQPPTQEHRSGQAVLDSRSEARAPQCQHYEGAPESNEIGPGRGRRGWHRPCHHRLERSRSGRGQKIDDTRQAAWILASSETRGRVRLVSFIGQRNSFSYRFLARFPKATGFSKLKERLLIVA